MPATPPTAGSARAVARPAAVVNEEIRNLVEKAGGWLYGETRQRYQVLRDEWTVAKAAERVDVDVAA